ncbi:hypothetical protein D3C86_2184210 [compost metagenome]
MELSAITPPLLATLTGPTPATSTTADAPEASSRAPGRTTTKASAASTSRAPSTWRAPISMVPPLATSP